jgi:hypothetical protein
MLLRKPDATIMFFECWSKFTFFFYYESELIEAIIIECILIMAKTNRATKVKKTETKTRVHREWHGTNFTIICVEK